MIFSLPRGIKMTISAVTVERRARYTMSAVCGLMLFGMAAWDAGWLQREPSYKNDSWYLVNEHSGFVVTSEFQDEAACMREEKTPGSCHSGKSLIADQAKNATSIERRS
jgi:putative AlgH/UPF0301 family transcriptional regulator